MGPSFPDAEEAIGVFTIGYFFKNVFRDFLENSTLTLSISKERVKFGSLEVGWAIVDFDDFSFGFESFIELLIAFNKELPDCISQEFFLP